MSKTLLSVMLLVVVCLLLQCRAQSLSKQETDGAQASKEKAAHLCQAAKDKREMYFGIWKKQFLKRNAMTQGFFDRHVTVTGYDIACQWVSGLSLRVEYQVNYDWAVINQHDQLVVLLYSQEEAYRHLPIKRDQLFDEDEVATAIDNELFVSSITPVKSLDKLRFSSYEEALRVFRKRLGGRQPEDVGLSFYVPGRAPHRDGYPYLHGRAVVDMGKNVCIRGYMNLSTGETLTQQSSCWVN